MTTVFRLLLLLALCTQIGSPPAAAHHSYAMFDMQRTLRLEATVIRFRWQNPHAFIEANMRAGDSSERWLIEMTSPNALIQSGWRRTSLRAGDRVVLYVHPLRDGTRGGSYVGVVLADGSTLGETG